MSIDAEQDLRQRLGRALGGLGARPAPVGSAMRHGSVIRRRRQVTAAALAAVVTAAVAVPVALHARPAGNAANPLGRHTATVNPPGPHAPAGLIAWGRVDGHRWTLTAGRPGAAPAGPGGQCFTVMGSQNCEPVLTAHGRAPAGLTAFPIAGKTAYKDGPAAVYGPVAADVAALRVRLAGGTVLTLRPATVYGTRFVAFVADQVTVSSITAYSHRHELGTMIPFRDGGRLFLGNWLRPGFRNWPWPGQRIMLTRVTRVIGAGRTEGYSWSVRVHQGPWGRCLLAAQPGVTRTHCLPGDSPVGTSLAGTSAGPVRVSYGTAAADVEHVVITLSDAASVRVRAVSAGNQKYFAFAHGTGVRAVRWASYDRAGHMAGTGQVTGRF